MKKLLSLSFALICLSYAATAQQVSVCMGEQVCLTLTNPRGSIEWQKSTDQINWTILGNQTDDTLCFTATASAWYRARFFEGSCGVVYSDTTYVIANTTVMAEAGTDQEYCQGGTAQLGGNPSAIGGTPPYTYEWMPATGLNSTSIANPVSSALTTTDYVLTVTDSAGCMDRDTVTVTVNQLPMAMAGNDTTIPCSLNVVIGGVPTAMGGNPPYSYLWTPNTQLYYDTMANPLADPFDTITYHLQVTDSKGCTSADSVTVNVTGGGGATGNVTFVYTGSPQTFVVPPCVDTIFIQTWGAEGANSQDRLPSNSTGGRGGETSGYLPVIEGETLYVFVGGQGQTSGVGGFNGGGTGGIGTPSDCAGGKGGGGGGASDVRRNGQNLSDRVIVAGGGGGAGRDYCNGSCQPCGCGGSGGGGGGLTGNPGNAAMNCGYSYPGSNSNFGGGGSQSAGGAGGPCDPSGTNVGTAGTLGTGGTGAPGNQDVAGGGGGGGYYGGGGGGGASWGNGVGGGGGGGGSSYIGGVINGNTTQNVRQGNGQVIISW